MLTVYGCATTRSVRVVWLLEELGAPYDYHFVSLRSGEHRRAPFIELDPAGKVPVVVDEDGGVLTESVAICIWLADRHPEAGLVPLPGSAERGRHDAFCAYVNAELEQPLWTIAKHTFALPEQHRVPGVEPTARWEFSRAAKVFEQRLGDREYLVGDRFTVADLLAGHTLSWARNRIGGLESAALNVYLDRLLERPALARAREREQAAADAA